MKNLSFRWNNIPKNSRKRTVQTTLSIPQTPNPNMKKGTKITTMRTQIGEGERFYESGCTWLN